MADIHDEIRAAIVADQSLRDLAVVGDDAEIAKQLKVTGDAGFIITPASLIELFNAAKAFGILAALRASPDATTVEFLRIVENGGLDSDARGVQAFINNGLVTSGILTDQQARKINRQTRQPTAKEVSKALRPHRTDGKAGTLTGL